MKDRCPLADGSGLDRFGSAYQTERPTVLRIVLTWLPRKMSAMMAMIAMSARIRAYSARPWPSSSRRNVSIRALSAVNVADPPFFRGSSLGEGWVTVRWYYASVNDMAQTLVHP